MQTNTNKTNNTPTLQQTTGGKYEPNIASMRKQQRILQGTRNVKTHNRTAQKKHTNHPRVPQVLAKS